MKKVISSMICVVALTCASNMFAMAEKYEKLFPGDKSKLAKSLGNEQDFNTAAKRARLDVTWADYQASLAQKPAPPAGAGTTSGTGTGGGVTTGGVTTGGGAGPDAIETAVLAVETAMNALGGTAQKTTVVDNARKQNIMARVQTAANNARKTAGV